MNIYRLIASVMLMAGAANAETLVKTEWTCIHVPSNAVGVSIWMDSASASNYIEVSFSNEESDTVTLTLSNKISMENFRARSGDCLFVRGLCGKVHVAWKILEEARAGGCKWTWFNGASHWCDSGDCTRGGCYPKDEPTYFDIDIPRSSVECPVCWDQRGHARKLGQPIALRTVKDCSVGATMYEDVGVTIHLVSVCPTGEKCLMRRWDFFSSTPVTQTGGIDLRARWMAAYEGPPEAYSWGKWIPTDSRHVRVVRYAGEKQQIGYVCPRGHLWWKDVTVQP